MLGIEETVANNLDPVPVFTRFSSYIPGLATHSGPIGNSFLSALFSRW